MKPREAGGTGIRLIFCGAVIMVITLLLRIYLFGFSLPATMFPGNFNCLSYAPFHEGQQAGVAPFPTLAQMDEDMGILRSYTGRIRTYGSREGMEALPGLLRSRGMKMTAGAWLGQDTGSNELEIAALIKQAKNYPDVIDRVIVGNEVLLRKDMRPDQLRAYLRTIKQSIRQPVSYADVWEYWLKYPELAQDVDFITVHFLPYWEDTPINVEKSAAHIHDCYRRIREAFPNKPIFIGESGWPTAGRPRRDAVPGPNNALRFIGGFKAMAEKEKWDYSLFEAFDQQWKSAYEGTVGANWGIFDQHRRLKFGSAGLATEQSRRKTGLTLFFFLSLLGVTATGRSLRRMQIRNVSLFSLLSAAMAGLLTLAWQRSFPVGLTIDSAIASATLVLQFFLAFFLLRQTAWHLEKPDPEKGNEGWLKAGKILFSMLVILSILRTGLFVFEGRYRDFPTDSFLVPAFGTYISILIVMAAERNGREKATTSILQGFIVQCRDRMTGMGAVFGCLLIILAIAVGSTEGFVNGEARVCVTALILLAFASPLWRVYGCKKVNSVS